MPKSKREKVLHLSHVNKKTREHKERLFARIRDAVPEFQYCIVVRVENMRNQHLKDLRQTFSDSRLFLGKTKLMARALGTAPEDALVPGIDRLASAYLKGAVGVLCTNRAPDAVQAALKEERPTDFARAGTIAPRTVVVPRGVLYSTGGSVPALDDVPVAAALEPELRRLGMPTRMRKGLVVLEEAPDNADGDNGDGGYTICKQGQILDSRQTRLLRLFDICLAEFRLEVLAYWSAVSGEVTQVAPLPSSSSKGGRSEDEAIQDAEVSTDDE